MRILYLTPGCFDKGGISRYCRYQIRALRERFGQANVRVYSVLGPDAESFEDSVEVAWYAGSVSRTGKLAYVARVVLDAATFRPDVVLSAHVNLAGLARVVAAAVRARTVLNVYGAEVWSGFRFDSAWGLKNVDQVIADCHFTANYLEQEGLRPRGSVKVVWDCVDLERFSPGEPSARVLARYSLPDPATGTTLMTLGRMSATASHKGYHRLLNAFVEIAADVPTLRLVFAGRGDLVEELRGAAKHAGLEERVFFTGMIDESDLADVYRAAHIFSLISDRGPEFRGEGIPLTPLEAAACGVPILVGDQDGSQEAVVQGVNGYVLDPFALDAHAERITELVRDVATRRRMGDAAAQRIRDEFGYQRFAEQTLACLREWFGPGATKETRPSVSAKQREERRS